MFSRIQANIFRQVKALRLLRELSEEEFTYLTQRDIDNVSLMEFSIHELMRQLFNERTEIKNIMNGVKVREYADMLPPDDNETLKDLLHSMDQEEQYCARQSRLNSDLALSLMDQGQALMDYLYSQAVPKARDTYSTKGYMKENKLGASLLSGRC